MPKWQFNEVHTRRVAAPPAIVFEAIRAIRSGEILFFDTLTWIRRLGRKTPECILNAGNSLPLLDVATRTGFIWLADDPPHELVIGTLLIAPRGSSKEITPAMFRQELAPGFAIAAMNFTVRADGDGSIVSTETRVYANDNRSRRRFAVYWFFIYPGSALLRRTWLRAIARRAENVARQR
jgi:hypothetical protein